MSIVNLSSEALFLLCTFVFKMAIEDSTVKLREATRAKNKTEEQHDFGG